MEQYYDFLPPIIWTENFPVYSVSSPFISGYWGHDFYIDTIKCRDQYLGFDVRNEEQSVEPGDPSGILEVLRGGFDPQATELALSTCSGECIPPVTQEEYQFSVRP